MLLRRSREDDRADVMLLLTERLLLQGAIPKHTHSAGGGQACTVLSLFLSAALGVVMLSLRATIPVSTRQRGVDQSGGRAPNLARSVQLVQINEVPNNEAMLEDIKGMSAEDITAALKDMSISTAATVDKEDLVQKLYKARLDAALGSNNVPAASRNISADTYSKTGSCTPGKVAHLSEADWYEEVSHPSSPILLDVYAEWCGPCRMMAPRLDAVADKLQTGVRVIKLNSDECPDVSNQLQVRALPTFMVFNRQGLQVARHTGMTSEENLIKMIAEAENARVLYIWTQAGVKYLLEQGFHTALGSPSAGSGATDSQLQLMAQEGGDGVVQQAIDAGFLEFPDGALDELRALPTQDIKDELIKRWITKLNSFDKEDLVKSLYVARLEDEAPAANSTEATSTPAPVL